MSDWDLVVKRNALDVARQAKLLGVYDYSVKRSKDTDVAFRNYISNSLKKVKEEMTRVMEIAHKERDEIKQTVKRVRDDIDLAAGDINIAEYWKFPEGASSLEKIVKLDLKIMSSVEGAKNFAANLYSQLVNSQPVDVEKKAEQIKRLVNDVRVCVIDRRELIKAR
ncbi:MAG TPA: hypothetical protein VJA47_02990 [archaeon]|nr:hypothetical protein [archaeon]